MNKKLLFAIAIAFLCLNLLLVFHNLSNQRDWEKQIKKLRSKIEVNEKWSELCWSHMELTNNVLNNSNLLTEEFDTLRFCDLTTANDRLYLFYTEIDCNSCIDASIEAVKKFENEHPEFDITVICKYQNTADLVRFKRIHQLEKEILNLKDEQSLVNHIDMRLPMFFLANANMRIKMPFIVAAPFYDRIEDYLTLVLRNHLQNADQIDD